MVAPSSLSSMCAFGNTVSLSVITFVAWVFITARIINGCSFYGGIRSDVAHAIGDMINRGNWCSVKREVAQKAVGLLVAMMFNFIFSSVAIWFRQVKPLVFVNLVISLPVQMGFGAFCFFVASVATNKEYVINADLPTCVAGVVVGLMSFITPLIVYISIVRCRPEVYQMDRDREEEERRERRLFELRVRELTNEIVTHQEMERQYRARGGGRGGRGGRGDVGRGGGRGMARGGGAPGRGGGGPSTNTRGRGSVAPRASAASVTNMIQQQESSSNDNKSKDDTTSALYDPPTSATADGTSSSTAVVEMPPATSDVNTNNNNNSQRNSATKFTATADGTQYVAWADGNEEK